MYKVLKDMEAEDITFYFRKDKLKDGAIAGATREALMQIAEKATGLNGGGKIAICRHKDILSHLLIFYSL